MGKKICTCVGACRGAKALGDDWVCALEEADRVLVEELPTIPMADPPKPPPASKCRDWVKMGYALKLDKGEYDLYCGGGMWGDREEAEAELHKFPGAVVVPVYAGTPPTDPPPDSAVEETSGPVLDHAKYLPGVRASCFCECHLDERSDDCGCCYNAALAIAEQVALVPTDPAIAAWREVPKRKRQEVISWLYGAPVDDADDAAAAALEALGKGE